MRMTQRRVLAFFGAAAFAVVTLGITAYACTNLSTINLSTGSARPGDTMTATGTAFGGGGCGCRPRGVSPVSIHWNGREGPVLAEASADRVGNISATFTVPSDAKPGFYTIVATQRDEVLEMDYYGTPAMASLEVLGPNGESVVARPSTAAGTADPETATAGILGLTIALGVLSLGLFAAAAILIVRQLVGRKAPEPARVTKS